MEIKRDKYLSDLVVRRGNGMVKVVTGARRCGKSYLLFRLFIRYLKENDIDDAHIVALALDDDENAAYRNPEQLGLYLRSRIVDEEATYYVLLDEIQYAISDDELRDRSNPPRLYGILNGLLRRRNVDVYVTGSNSKLLSTDVMTEFRGRGDEVRVRPLSFSEFVSAYQEDRANAWRDYAVFGGMPLTLSMGTNEQRMYYLRNLFDETYLKDIVERNHVEKTQELDDLVNILASGIGSLTSISKVAATFKSVAHKDISERTIIKYIGYLKDAFVISEAMRYDIKGRRYIGSPKKYYFVDLGLRNARLGFRQLDEPHIVENVVYKELCARGYAVDVGVVADRRMVDGKQRRSQLEVDFVANLVNKRYYIQVAQGLDDLGKEEQEKRPLRNIPDSFKRVLVLRDALMPHYDSDGFLVLSLRDFLLDEDSLDI